VPANVSATAASRSATLTWSASSDDVGVSGYRVYRDDVEIGTTATAGYSDSGLDPGTTYSYRVAAYDAAGNLSDRSVPVSVTTPTQADPLALDKVVTTHQSAAATTIASPALSTTRPNELLLAFIASDGPSATAGAQSINGVAGGGLTWTLRQRTNTRGGTAEIWQTVAPAAVTNLVVTATRKVSAQGALSVAAFTGAETAALGAVGTANAATGAPRVSLTTTRANSWVWGVGIDYDAAVARTLGSGQTLVDSYFSPSGDTYWVQRRTAVTPAAGTSVTLDDSAPTNDQFNLSAIEILGGA
jgi:Fibronectin type III domain